jgi:aflatoxin B1 aldehyde reductase
VAEVALLAAHNGWIRPTVWQGMYNAITRGIETELIPVCRRFGIDIVVYNPLAGGLFSGKYKLDETPSDGRFSDVNPKTGANYRSRYFRNYTFEALKIVQPVVEKHGLTLIETALRWVVHHSKLNIKNGNDGIIIGVSSLDQLKGNLTDLEKGPLPEEVVQALDQAWLVAKATAPDYWHLKLEYTYDTVKSTFG